MRSGRSGRPRPPDRSDEERLSRLLAFVLRHHPEELNVTLDARGSVDLDVLAAAIGSQPKFSTVTRREIEDFVATGPAAQRFEIADNRIRARYGHTLPQTIEYEPAEPPELLFHGTTPQDANAILAEGLKPGEMQRVHLSVDTPAAREVGRHRSQYPVVLRIDTVCAQKGGTKFYRGGPVVWLSDEIPPQCITKAE
ncbi:MAG: RNA 2'-phosphotransferase [Planctomycetota bacterium]|nr:RNA 2'-phosphotransferase [Planctomycetota bacterium]